MTLPYYLTPCPFCGWLVRKDLITAHMTFCVYRKPRSGHQIARSGPSI